MLHNLLNSGRIRQILAGTAWLLLLVGCTLGVSPADGNPSPLPPTGIPSPTPSPTSLDSPTPTQTKTVTLTPSPTATLHPLMIESMRRLEYPGSPIEIEQTLPPGANYHRYLAAYRSEGLKIYAYMTVPYGDPPDGGWPVIVFNHGYIPPTQYRSTERYVAYVNAFASRGYIVFRPDYRGHGDSEGEARGAYSRPDYTIDVLNATTSIQKYPLANPDRIGMWGHSMGGHLTLRAMVTTDVVKAGVIWAGVVGSYPDMLERWRSTVVPEARPAARRFTQELLSTQGTPKENPDFWNAISPISFVADISGPLQLHHGSADTSVPVSFSQSLSDAVTAAGGEVEFFIYPDDDHNLSQSFSTAILRSVEFFDRYLKP